ncbi:MAG: 50S ribosomal protein L28, partial [Clostridia bacterium]|nr:50S ribosomal protein L28 [Clostridia bacterium]
MGKFCEVCKKGTMSGNLVSHSNRKTKRSWAPNIQTVHVVVDG